MTLWNPWHGCHKYSAGCANCYVYRMDERYGRDSSVVKKTKDFALPVKKKKMVPGRYRKVLSILALALISLWKRQMHGARKHGAS